LHTFPFICFFIYIYNLMLFYYKNQEFFIFKYYKFYIYIFIDKNKSDHTAAFVNIIYPKKMVHLFSLFLFIVIVLLGAVKINNTTNTTIIVGHRGSIPIHCVQNCTKVDDIDISLLKIDIILYYHVFNFM